MTLLYDAGRLWADVTAEVPVAAYPAGQQPDPARVAGVDLGIIHPYAVAGPDGQALLVSGRAVRAEHRMHLKDSKARQRAVARRAPKPGQRGSRRWRHYRRRQRLAEARHRRRVRQAQHEAARVVTGWAAARRIGTLAVGDPRGVLGIAAGRRHNRRTRDWRIGHLITVLRDKAGLAGSPSCWPTSGAPPPPAPPAQPASPSPRAGCSAARAAGCPGTATCSRPPTSPGVSPAAPRQPSPRPASRTAAPEPTCPVCPRHDVTRAAAPITATPAGPLAGTCPPRPPPRRAGESLAPRRGPRKTTDKLTKRCTSPRQRLRRASWGLRSPRSRSASRPRRP